MNEMNETILNEGELEEVSGGKVYGDGSRYIIEYEVERGDTLTKIANRYNSTVNNIMKLNPIIKDRNKIYPKWVLKVCVNDK